MSEVLDLGKIKASHKDWLEFIKSGKVLPYFQPIVSLESCSVFGYEALGRIEFPGGRIESLGSFFGARIESQEFFELQKKIDLEIRALSMRFLLEDPNRESKLFINISPLTMMSELRELEKEIPFTIRQSRELGIQSSRIIIEMTEGSFNFNPEVVRPLIETYRAEGFLIAIDDVGSESSNLDRIGLFHPDIIKVDLQLLRRSVLHRSFQEIIQTLSVLSESLGSSLIFEGIETEEELYKAMSSGSRYLQGFIFAKAREDFAKELEFQEQLSTFLSLFYTRKIQEIKDKVFWEKEILSVLNSLEFQIRFENNICHIICKDLHSFEIPIFRLFVTDFSGMQVSPNYLLDKERTLTKEFDAIGKNWCWRTFFLEHVYKSQNVQNSNWMISLPYQDILGNAILRTFSKNLEGGYILFIDILFNPVSSTETGIHKN